VKPFHRARLGHRPPWSLLLPPLACAAAVALPLAYLVRRALEVPGDELADLLLTAENARLLGNTLALTATVLLATTLLAMPLAWLTSSTDLPARRALALVGVLPLAVPGYLMAYTLLSLGGNYGLLAHLFGGSAAPPPAWPGAWPPPRMSGFTGAAIALALSNFPYMFLNLRAAMLELDPALSSTARSLGHGPFSTFFRVILPHLRPALAAGGLLIGLHVVADFGVVSLMRFDTLSRALYVQYASAFNRTEAAWIALMLIALAALFLAAEALALRRVRLERAAAGTSRARQRVPLGPWQWPSLLFVALLATGAVIVPVATILAWCARSSLFTEAPALPWAGAASPRTRLLLDLGNATWNSLKASGPAALLAAALALPIAYAPHRYPGRLTRLAERVSLLGYATPSLAFALGLIFFALRFEVGGRTPLYQSLALLVYAYALHFLAEAIGPVRSALFAAPARLEEVARTLGAGPLAAFARVTLPRVKSGLLVSFALVFLSAMKELPLTMLLAPLDFSTLATEVWDQTHEARFEEAAPYALGILLIAFALVGLLLLRGESELRD